MKRRAYPTHILISGRCRIKELSKLDGEASANNRKGKLIFFYEWDVKAEWEGEIMEEWSVL